MLLQQTDEYDENVGALGLVTAASVEELATLIAERVLTESNGQPYKWTISQPKAQPPGAFIRQWSLLIMLSCLIKLPLCCNKLVLTIC